MVKNNRYCPAHTGIPGATEENCYPEYVRQKNIIDILHQITVVLYRNDEMVREFNRFFRLSLEPMLLHADVEGKYDCDFNEEKAND